MSLDFYLTIFKGSDYNTWHILVTNGEGDATKYI